MRRCRAHDARVEHGVEHATVTGEDIGQARRAAHDKGDETHQLWVGVQKREQLHPRRQLAQEAVEAGERGIRIDGLRERLDEQGLDHGQAGTGAFRGNGWIAAAMPGADGAEDLGGLGEAHRRERRHRLRVVILAGEHEVGGGGRQFGVVLEERGIMFLDGAQPLEQCLGEGRRRLVA